MYTLVEVAVTVGVLAALVSALTACVCGCKNSNQKSELVGTAGVVKLRFDEEAPSPTPTTPASINRASTQNSHRSLPEIPHQVGRHDSGDTASEIYATVNIDNGTKVEAEPSTSRDHPYEHAYAKLQKESHVTVEVTPEVRTEDLPIDEREASQSGPESVVISASVAISGQLPSSQELPYITPALDHAPHFSGDSTDSAKGYTSISVREPLSNIRAQAAPAPRAPPHYATVSDDSDEMYAAIEGGSDTYAQIAAPAEERAHNNQLMPDTSARRSAPPEMGSTANGTHSRQGETKSQPESTPEHKSSSSSCTNSTGALGSPKPEKRQANSPLPPPPRDPPRPRSPLPQALAVKQQRISSTGDLHFNHDKLRRSLNEKHQRNNSCVSSSDFYGCNYPVDKHRFSSGDLIRPLVAKELNFDIDTNDAPTDNLYNSIDGPHCSDYSSTEPNTSINSERVTESPSRNLDDMYAKVNKKSKGKTDETKRKSKDLDNGETSKLRGDDPGYETIERKKSMNHNYETIAHKERKISQNQDPGYETVKDIHKLGPNAIYANNNLLNKLNHLADSGPNSMISSDPGYEHISKINDNSASDSDPNYEVLRNQPSTPPYATIAPNYKVQPTYSTVNKKDKYSDWSANNNDEAAMEPHYSSMPHEPLYTTGSESDPNYESVRPKDPNYESVSTQDPNYESLRLKDPKYESVRSKSSTRSKDPNYESVKYFELSKTEPPYEKVNAGASGVERSDSAAGYERINVARDPRSSISNGGGVEPTVSDYFQV
ncbi:uncharacterized protein LOC105383881 isoform X1 [Plutella xylostella]|uniref:uncharacterized protein LOC105383881 isoform X1 n=1 Tax=Plutella xylostella TaxID=51655 RepID=UPI00203225C5|nr:uncharacterized protein LOC105383881 isoform X1 [Plutella xylostella]